MQEEHLYKMKKLRKDTYNKKETPMTFTLRRTKKKESNLQ